jgi:peptidoglycan/LPS O-acetylase OafA/YrhL
MTLGTRLGSRSNHFTLIRLFLALLVIFSHAFALGGFGDERILGGNDKYGNLAVNSFFVVSGLLVSMSFARTRGFVRFARNRFLRIVPAYWFALLVTALLLCPFVHWLLGGNAVEYWMPKENSPFSFILKNVALKMNQTQIGNMFRDNPTRSR